MKILKFGGTSLGNFEMINKSSEIILKAKGNEDVIVVVSAMSGVTNLLIELSEFALSGDKQKISENLLFIREKHLEVLRQKTDGKNIKQIEDEINEIIKNLEIILDSIFLLKQLSNRNKAVILYFGEILSSKLLSYFIKEKGIFSKSYLSRDYLVSSGKYLDGDCDIIESKKILKKFMENVDLKNEIPVFTGFGGGNKGDVYLFDRGGSDYVATLLGGISNASCVEIWTDTNGVMSADPRKVDFPIIWNELDYEVASEFALSGAKILHPKTLSPVQEKNIPVYIKNTFFENSSGTKICKIDGEKGLKGVNISSKGVILTFIDPSMIGAAGFVYSVIKILENENVPIDVMATTETSFSISICEKYFSQELVEKLQNMKNQFKLVIEKDVCKISIVGDSINTHSILECIDEILMISKGAYNKCLTIYAKSDNPDRLLRHLHKNLFER